MTVEHARAKSKRVDNPRDALAVLFGAKAAQRLALGFADVSAIFEAEHKSARLPARAAAVRALAHAMTERSLKSRDALASWHAVMARAVDLFQELSKSGA